MTPPALGRARRIGRWAKWLCVRGIAGLVRQGLPRAAAAVAGWIFPPLTRSRPLREGPPGEGVVHVFDPFLHDAAGHYLGFDRAIHEQVEAAAHWRTRFYGRVDLSDEVSRALPVTPFFVKGARWGIGEGRSRGEGGESFADTGRPERLSRSRRWIEFNRRRLQALGKAWIRPGDVLIFPTLNAQSMPATIARWLPDLPGSRSLLVVICFMLPDYAAPGDGGVQGDYAELFDVLAKHPPDSVVLIAETSQMRDDLLRRTGHRIPIAVAPHFKPERILSKLAETRQKAPIAGSPRVGYAGHARRDRGAHLVPEVLRRLQQGRPGTRFRVHVQDRVWSAMDLGALAGLEELELRTETLGIQEFYEYVAGIDVMLLPFEPGPRTTLQGSGVFWEALALGLVMVLPRGSHFEEEARIWDAGFTTFSGWHPEAVAEAAMQALGDYEGLASRARSAAAKWRLEKSPSLFFQQILSPELAQRRRSRLEAKAPC